MDNYTIKLFSIVTVLFAFGTLLPRTAGAYQMNVVVGDGSSASCTESALDTAVASINAAAGGNLSFSCGSSMVTIPVTTTKVFEHDVTIDGGGRITLDGGGNTRVLFNDKRKTMTVRNLRIINGYAPDQGGAISNSWRGNLNVYNSIFENNVANGNGGHGGGAIFNHEATLIIADSEFTNNTSHSAGTADGGGGAVYGLLSNVIITNSRFVGNRATASAGGAFYSDGTLNQNGYIGLFNNQWIDNEGSREGGAVFTFLYPDRVGSYVEIRDNLFKDNVVLLAMNRNNSLFSGGGGLRHGNGPLILSNSAFINNMAYRQGGGIWIGENSAATLTNLTLSGNQANDPNEDNQGLGGGIMTGNGAVNISHTTIVNNYAGFMGGGMFGGGAGVQLRNSIVAKNTVGNPWDININCAETYTDGGSNIQDSQRKPHDTNDHDCTPHMIIADPLIMDLRSNDPLPNHPLQASSPALDGAYQCGASDDQIGTLRPQGGICDIDAIEMPVEPVPPRLYPLSGAVINASTYQGPNFQFSHVEGTEWYRVWVGKTDGTRYFDQAMYQWFNASVICSGGVCTIPNDLWLTNGNYAWWITRYSQADPNFGQKWHPSTLSVDFEPPAQTVTLTSPVAGVTLATAPNTISWARDTNVHWYRVWFGPADYSRGALFYQWVDATDSQYCNNTTCTIAVNAAQISDGEYHVYFQVWGPNGFYKWGGVNGGQPSVFTVGSG